MPSPEAELFFERLPPTDEPCRGCGARENVRTTPSFTSYPRKPGEPDPNAPLPLCEDCAEDHFLYWKERWDEYYAGLL